MHVYRFTFLCKNNDRRLLIRLAQRLERSQGDTIRFLLREKARELGILGSKTDEVTNFTDVNLLATRKENRS